LDLPQQLTSQIKGMERLVDGQTGSILFRHPELRGIPDLVVEGDGTTKEFIGSKLLCLDIQDPSGMVRLLAEPLKDQGPAHSAAGARADASGYRRDFSAPGGGRA
jgi:hypothetical protein